VGEQPQGYWRNSQLNFMLMENNHKPQQLPKLQSCSALAVIR
jgi:hypothetical protein